MAKLRDGRYPKKSFGRLLRRLVEQLFVVQLVVQLVGYLNLNWRHFFINKLSQNIETFFWAILEILGDFGQTPL